MRLAVVLTICMGLLGAAAAQKLECQPQNSCKRPLEFLPDASAYVAALDCADCQYLYPDPRSPELRLRLKRDKREAYSLEVSRSEWNPGANVELQAKYTLTGEGEDPLVLDWRAVDSLPQQLLSADTKRAEIGVEYRLKVDGSEPVGSFETTLSYVAQDALDKKNKKDRVTHAVRFVLGPTLVLRVEGNTADIGMPSVQFDVDRARILDYLNALETGEPLSPSFRDLNRVAVFSNYLNGYTLSARVEKTAGPAGGSLGSEDVLLGDAPLIDQTFTGLGPTASFETVLVGEDYGLHVDGGERPGSYRFTVTFEAIPNP